MKTKMKHGEKVNWPITILLILGCLTVFFPLYMTIVIAFKQPSEMTNDIMGALALPKGTSTRTPGKTSAERASGIR